MPSFAFRSRYALLTYAQCGELSPEAVLNHIRAVPAQCILGAEKHADGGNHFHCFVDFSERFYTSDCRRFDVEGYHPNIKACGRTPGKMYDYAIKDRNVFGEMDRPGTAGEDVSGAGAIWDDIIGQPTADLFWDAVRRLAPRQLLVSFPSLRSYAEWHYRPTMEHYEHPDRIELRLDGMEELSGWVCDNLSGSVHGSHVYQCGLFNVDDMKAEIGEAEYAIFDDMQGGFEFFHGYKNWLGGQLKFSVTDKYKGKTSVNWGRPTIWLMNDDPTQCKGVDYEWLEGNCLIYHLTEPIAHAST
nr:replication-associated protein [Tick-associated genomovirus 2]